MLEAVRDFREQTGQMIGVKPAGGIRTSKDAIKYLVTVAETVSLMVLPEPAPAMIDQNDIDALVNQLAGGADAPIHPIPTTRWNQRIRRLSQSQPPRTCRTTRILPAAFISGVAVSAASSTFG